MAVTAGNLWSVAWDTIYSVIDDNTTDPTNKSKWVYSSFPDALFEDKSSYPLIVINPVEADGSNPIVLDYTTKTFSLSLVIEIYSTSNWQLDKVTDEVFNAIESNESTLCNNGIYNFELSTVSNDTIERGKIRVHIRTLEWSFEFQRVGLQ